MRRILLCLCACLAFLAGCSDDESKRRTKLIEPAPGPVKQDPKASLDQTIEEAVRRELKAQVSAAAAADPRWASYPTLTDDSRRSEMPDEAPANQVRVYLRGLGTLVPVDTLQDVAVSLLPERLEIELRYPSVSVKMVDVTTGSREADQIPDGWSALAPKIDDARWSAIERDVIAGLGDGGPGVDVVKKRVDDYRRHSARWQPAFSSQFNTRVKFMRAALWASPDHIDRADLTKAYCFARAMMSKTAVVASIPGPPEVPIAPVLGGPVFGLQRGRAGVDREIHGAMSGADGVWLEIHMTSTDSKPIAETEAFTNGFFDTMRPFETRANDAAQVMQSMKAAQKSDDPARSRRAALLALSAFHLDPKPKHAQTLVSVWGQKEPRPSEEELKTLADQVGTLVKASPALKKDLQDAVKGRK